MNFNRKNKHEQKNKNNEKNLLILYSKETNEKIAKVKIADTFFSRLKGLMLKKNTDYPLLFKMRKIRKNRWESSIHSCFMRFELKLVFIDKNNTVFEMADLKPWRYYVPKKGAKYIIEFSKDDFDEDRLKIGDVIEIEHEKY